jgi:predicted secreted protein
MKLSCLRYLTGVAFFCSIAFGSKAVVVEGSSVKVLSVQDKGQVFQVKLGESFLVSLPNPGSGGYVVQDTPEFDAEVLILQKMEKRPPSDPHREGDFGTLEWTFRAKKEGFSVLIVRASRPWEKDKPPRVIFEASIHVSQ